MSFIFVNVTNALAYRKLKNFIELGPMQKNIQLIFNTFAKYIKGTNTVKDV